MFDLNIVEIFYETGQLRYRYARELSNDGTRWIRDGRFTDFHKNGQLASEGNYVAGYEHGAWRDFYEKGQVAAEGCYEEGNETGDWKYWNTSGVLE